MDVKQRIVVALTVLTASISTFRGAEAAPPERSIFNAVREDDTEAIRRWLAKDIKLLNAYDADGMTPLHIAICRYKPLSFGLLLASGADVRLSTKSGRLRIVSNERIYLIGLSRSGWTPLHMAAQGNRTDMVKALMARGANINARTDFGETPIYIACAEGYTTMTRLLISHGADVNIPARPRGWTPLQGAVFGGYENLAQFLFANGAEPDVLSAAGLGLKYEVDRLMKKGDKSLTAYIAEENPLYWAARGGHGNLLRDLIAKGAKTEIRDERGATPLIEAATLGYANVVRALLAEGADVNARDRSGSTALHGASAGGHVTVVRALLDHNASPAAKDAKGQNPVELALANGHPIVADLLENRGPESTADSSMRRR